MIFAHWYEIQAKEERDHAMMMRKYLLDNGYRVTFKAIAKPDKSCPLLRRIDIQRTTHNLRVIRNNPNHTSIKPGKSDNQILRKGCVNLKKAVLVYKRIQNPFYSVDDSLIIRYNIF